MRSLALRCAGHVVAHCRSSTVVDCKKKRPGRRQPAEAQEILACNESKTLPLQTLEVHAHHQRLFVSFGGRFAGWRMPTRGKASSRPALKRF